MLKINEEKKKKKGSKIYALHKISPIFFLSYLIIHKS